MDPDEITPGSGDAPPVGEDVTSPPADAATPGDGATPGEGDAPPASEDGEIDWAVAGPRYQTLAQLWDKGEHPTLKASRSLSEKRKVQLEKLTSSHENLQLMHGRVLAAFDKVYAQVTKDMTPEEKTAFENQVRVDLQGPASTAPGPSQPTSKEDTLEPTLRQILEAGGFEWGDPRFDVGEPGEDATTRIASLTTQIADIKKVTQELPGSPPPTRHPTDANGGATTARSKRLTLAKLNAMTPQEIAKLDQEEVDRALEAAK